MNGDGAECGADVVVNGQTFTCVLSGRHDMHPTCHAARGESDDGRHWSLYWTGTPEGDRP